MIKSKKFSVDMEKTIEDTSSKLTQDDITVHKLL